MLIWLQLGHFHCTTQGFQRSKKSIQQVVKAFATLSSNEFNNYLLQVSNLAICNLCNFSQ